MSDHLNSIHLEAPRREEFRHARARLIDACGERTRYGIRPPEAPAETSDSKTIFERIGSKIPAGTEFALVDKNCVYPLKTGLNTIGRLPDNDVVIEDAFVSRRHCAVLIHTSSDGCELHDVASKNGTFLNGTKLAGPTPIHSGDEIRMCDKQLVFLCKSDPRNVPAHAATLMK